MWQASQKLTPDFFKFFSSISVSNIEVDDYVFFRYEDIMQLHVSILQSSRDPQTSAYSACRLPGVLSRLVSEHIVEYDVVSSKRQRIYVFFLHWEPNGSGEPGVVAPKFPRRQQWPGRQSL